MSAGRIIHIILTALAITGVLALFGFASSSGRATLCHQLNITVVSGSGDYFISAEKVRNIITETFDTLEGQYIDRQKLAKLHHTVQSVDYADKAKVYRSLNGLIGVEISLREPLMRVINSDNQSFYIDIHGTMFPLSDAHTARVMLASGHIAFAYEPGINLADLPGRGPEEGGICPAGLYELARFIHNDVFWKSFIDHIYALPNGKFELIPRNGVHTVEFGKAELIEEKFRKLKLFYLNGLPRKGWHYYRRINLEFNNQVVCSK